MELFAYFDSYAASFACRNGDALFHLDQIGSDSHSSHLKTLASTVPTESEKCNKPLTRALLPICCFPSRESACNTNVFFIRSHRSVVQKCTHGTSTIALFTTFTDAAAAAVMRYFSPLQHSRERFNLYWFCSSESGSARCCVPCSTCRLVCLFFIRACRTFRSTAARTINNSRFCWDQHTWASNKSDITFIFVCIAKASVSPCLLSFWAVRPCCGAVEVEHSRFDCGAKPACPNCHPAQPTSSSSSTSTSSSVSSCFQCHPSGFFCLCDGSR